MSGAYRVTFRGLPSLHVVVDTMAQARERVAREVVAKRGRPVVGRVMKDGLLVAEFASVRGGAARFTKVGA